MAENAASGKRTVAILWFVAAALAVISVAIQLIQGDPPRWGVAAAGAFCLAMGIGAWSRRR